MPEIEQNEVIKRKMAKWDRAEALLLQDEEAITENFIRKFPNESETAFQERKKTFIDTFINLTMDLISAPINSVMRQSKKSEFSKENTLLEEFSQNVTRGSENVPYLEFIKDFVAISLRTYGNVFTVIDKPRAGKRNKLSERKDRRPYLSNIRPQDVLDWLVIDGELVWFAYKRLIKTPWHDPINDDKPAPESSICIWTNKELLVISEGGEVNKTESYPHSFDMVPVVIQASFLSQPNQLIGSASFDQTSNMIITYNNLLNLWVHELYKHGGSLLLMHEDTISAGNMKTDREGNPEIKRIDNNGAMEWSGSEKPEYLVKELATEAIEQAATYYMQRAIENERDLKAVVKGGMDANDYAESGVSKAIDRQPLEANLVCLCEDLEEYTTKVFDIVAIIVGEKNTYTLQWDKDFDVTTLMHKYDEIKKAQEAGIVKVSESLHKEMWKNVVPNVVRDADKQKEIIDQIDSSSIEDLDNTISNLVDATMNASQKKVDEE